MRAGSLLEAALRAVESGTSKGADQSKNDKRNSEARHEISTTARNADGLDTGADKVANGDDGSGTDGAGTQLAANMCSMAAVGATAACGAAVVGGCIATEGGGCVVAPWAMGVCTAAVGSAIGGCAGAIILQNKVKPVPDAEGPHSTWKEDPVTGQKARTETWVPNPQNPSGWDTDKATDITGRGHYDKGTGQIIPTPHTHLPDGSVRPATPDELPQ